jgi:hypothetical protein
VLLESTEPIEPYEKVLTMEPDLLVQQLGRVLLGIAPAGWHRLDLRVLMTGPARAMALTATMPDGGWMTAPVPPEAARIAAELRLLKYREGEGTWFSMRFMMDPPTRYWVSFNNGFEPPWDPPLLAEAYREDLLTYPRSPERTPAWLAEKVAQ